MGRIIYNPKEKQGKGKQKQGKEQSEVKEVLEVVQAVQQEQPEIIKTPIMPRKEETKFSNVRQVGEPDSEYKIYLEDYVYTYLYQYASINLTCEQSAVFLGKFYEEKGEVIISGIIPVSKEKLNYEDEWISKEALEKIEEIRDEYFAGMDFVGWMHMQPGYGTMLTMKEIKAHQEVFANSARILLLMDPINKIETFFVYEEELFKEQLGYIMYYERNEAMQRYMLEHPFAFEQKEAAEDVVVNQFREIGKARKKQYQDKKKTNFTVVAASVLILALTAVVVKMSDQGEQLKLLQDNVSTMSSGNETTKNNGVKVIVDTPKQEVANQEDKGTEEVNNQEVVDAASKNLTIVDKTETLEDAVTGKVSNENNENKTQEEVKEAVKEEPKEIAKEEAKEAVKEEPKEVVKEEVKETSKEVPYKIYVVQEGDTLRKISEDHFKTEGKTKEIIKLNGMENGDKIFVGEKIKLPLE